MKEIIKLKAFKTRNTISSTLLKKVSLKVNSSCHSQIPTTPLSGQIAEISFDKKKCLVQFVIKMIT